MKATVKRSLKTAIWYEGITLIVSLIMAFCHSWRIVYAWWDPMVSNNEHITMSLEEYIAVFCQELVWYIPIIIVLMVIALLASVLHVYIRSKK